MVELDWTLCAWCGKDFERPELLREGLVNRAMARPRSASSPELAEADDVTDVTDVTPTRRAASRPR
jgi:hypothetical protein